MSSFTSVLSDGKFRAGLLKLIRAGGLLFGFYLAQHGKSIDDVNTIIGGIISFVSVAFELYDVVVVDRNYKIALATPVPTETKP